MHVDLVLWKKDGIVTIIKCDCLYYHLTTTGCHGIDFKMHSNDKNQGFEKETKN